MSNLNLELRIEKMNWSSNYSKREITLSQKYKFENIRLTESIIDDLHTLILQIKEDLMTLKVSIVGENYYIYITLIFDDNDPTNKIDRTLNRVKEACESYFKNLQELGLKTTSNNFDLLNEIMNENGFVFKAHQIEEWGVAEEIKQLLATQNQDFKVIQHYQSRFDGGLSGGAEDFLFFIGSSVLSGVTWDVLKGILASKFEDERTNIKSTPINNEKFKKLRREVAERTREDYRELVLTDFYQNENELICEFKIYEPTMKTIMILCDLEYQIKELKYERK
ncbi:hypothetical protein [Saccharibacillus alkalitolerans]|uniref:Uncharacterized protein n=1 Tax=Saccharibacillus alkalitolerans TaxID=2705290 RepID=A0ABX0F7U3_9BACL|nr:hypothetical protein [Saccharibacillus alkalitolerans]NGZ76907.1 hypothetical protein [Saccharibacillus alkalitolerans]